MSFYKINSSTVDWESQDSFLFFNNRHGKKDAFISYIPRLPCLKAHIWLATSGRVQHKWVALSKHALLTSAQAVNQHLHVTSRDRWGLCLPLFHVGGLSMLARAHLSHSICFSYQGRWLTKSFVKFVNEHNITLSSLVPTQVYDLVKACIPCPPSLRAVVVGGENLSSTLYHKGRDLNWPLLPSYGLTECGSQVATAKTSSLNKKKQLMEKESNQHNVLQRRSGSLNGNNTPPLKVLPHVKVKVIKGEIAIQSESLLSGFVPLMSSVQTEYQDPKRQGWYFTGDKGRLRKNFLDIHRANQIKILGEKINPADLEERLMDILLRKSPLFGRYFLLPVFSQREGFQLALVSDVFDRQTLFDIVGEFNRQVSPFEKIRQFYFIPRFPLTDISKISKRTLLKKLGFSSGKPF